MATVPANAVHFRFKLTMEEAKYRSLPENLRNDIYGECFSYEPVDNDLSAWEYAGQEVATVQITIGQLCHLDVPFTLEYGVAKR